MFSIHGHTLRKKRKKQNNTSHIFLHTLITVAKNKNDEYLEYEHVKKCFIKVY